MSTPPCQSLPDSARVVVFPSPEPFAPVVGQRVFVWLRSDKTTGGAVVKEVPDAAHSQPPRYNVQYDDGTTYWARLERLHPVYDAPCTLLICSSTTGYRRLARSQVGAADAVAEVGSSYGVCTHVLSQHCASVVGIDNSSTLVSEARKRYPGLQFEHVDALLDKDGLMALLRGRNKVFADIGGNRQLESLLELLPAVMHGARPQLVVVKSEQLFDQARQHLDNSTGAPSPGPQNPMPCPPPLPPLPPAPPSSSQAQKHSAPQLAHAHTPPPSEAAAYTSNTPVSRGSELTAATDVSSARLHSTPSVPPPSDQMASLALSTSSCCPNPSGNICGSLRTGDAQQGARLPGQLPDPAGWWQAMLAAHPLNNQASTGSRPAGEPTPQLPLAVPAAEPWFLAARASGFRKSCMKYPQKHSPAGVRICRPFNYDTCHKAEACPFDHSHCHHCLTVGHRGSECLAGAAGEL